MFACVRVNLNNEVKKIWQADFFLYVTLLCWLSFSTWKWWNWDRLWCTIICLCNELEKILSYMTMLLSIKLYSLYNAFRWQYLERILDKSGWRFFQIFHSVSLLEIRNQNQACKDLLNTSIILKIKASDTATSRWDDVMETEVMNDEHLEMS